MNKEDRKDLPVEKQEVLALNDISNELEDLNKTLRLIYELMRARR
jgi:hypothetical protein